MITILLQSLYQLDLMLQSSWGGSLGVDQKRPASGTVPFSVFLYVFVFLVILVYFSFDLPWGTFWGQL